MAEFFRRPLFLPLAGWERAERQSKHSPANSRVSPCMLFSNVHSQNYPRTKDPPHPPPLLPRRKIVERDAAASIFHFGEHPSRMCLNASLTRYEPLSRGDRVINKTANETLDSRPFFLLAWREERGAERKERHGTSRIRVRIPFDDTYATCNRRVCRLASSLCHRVN